MEQKIMKALARKTDDAFEKEYEELNEKSFHRNLMQNFWKRQNSMTSDMRSGRKNEKAGRFCKRQQFFFSSFFLSIPLQSELRKPIASLYFKCLKTRRTVPLRFIIRQNLT